MKVTDLTWCEQHSQLLADYDIDPDAVVQSLLHSVALQGAKARGHGTSEDINLAAQAISRMAAGQPICCHLGDEKLTTIIASVLEAHKQ